MALYGGIQLPNRPDPENVRKLDLLPVPMIQRMTRYGIAIDSPYLLELGSQFGRMAAELAKDISSYIPVSQLSFFEAYATAIEERDGDAAFNPASAEQIGELLFKTLGIGSGSKLKTTKNGKRLSTGKKQLELLRKEHPIIGLVLKHRELDKLRKTYCDALPKKAVHHPRSQCCPVCELHHHAPTNRIHAQFPTTRTATGRLASRDPNLQNIPARTDYGGMVRKGFIASPGTRLVSRDFSQIELRNLAHCANAASMIDVYKQDKDIHIFTACACFHLDEKLYSHLAALDKSEMSPEHVKLFSDFKLHNRLPSKNLNFMIVYGATSVGLQAQLALSELLWTREECDGFINTWFGLYPEVREFMDEEYYHVRRYKAVWDGFGRTRLVPEIHSAHKWIRQAGFRQAGNMRVQSYSAGQFKLAGAEINDNITELLDAGVWAWPLLPIHDELITEVEEDYADAVNDMKAYCMDNVMIDKDTGEDHSLVPIKSAGGVMERWVKD